MLSLMYTCGNFLPAVLVVAKMIKNLDLGKKNEV